MMNFALFENCDVYRIEQGEKPKVCLYKNGEMIYSFISNEDEVKTIREMFPGKESMIY